MTLESAKVIIEVSAGIIPGTPEDDFTRRWAITSKEWELAELADAELLQQAQDTGNPAIANHAVHSSLLLAFRAAEADEYARLLRNPNRFNWTRTDWLWL